MIQIYILLLIFKFMPTTTQYFFIQMNDDYQMYTAKFQINSNDYNVKSYFSYGIWSRYTPLGRNNQVGTIGILDSSCFHLHNVIGQTSRLLNFLVFDCLEFPIQIIKRRISFKASNDQWYHIEAIIDNFQYEYVWHYFEITSWPFEQKLQLIFIQYPQTILNKLIDVSFPYSDLNLMLTFGGGLYIDQYQNIPGIEEGSKFSFFPGKMYLYPLIKGENKKKTDYLEVIDSFELTECICSFNIESDIPDKDLKFLQSQIFTSQYSNCNNFALKTWIKITNIKADVSEFTYQLMKLSAVFSNSKLTNENLAAFQLSYMLSPIGNKILITTYSYTFPLVNIDFSDNPFLIQREIDIFNDIRLWHYISLGVIDNEFQLYITYYEDLMEYYYDIFESVNHFHMVRLQLEYGNVQKQSTNYLDVQFRNLNFENCPYFIDSFAFCHFSCERCDGPTSTSCLSCFQSSNRIYLPEHKSCICPYDTIDNYECQGYQELELSLNQGDQPLTKCQFGYFEFDNECILCPSIIQEKFMTCLDCLYNPDSWQTKLFCEINLSFYDDGQISKQIKEIKQYFISDSNEINFCSWCNSSNNSLYEDYQFHTQEFQQFCLTTDIDKLSIEQKQKCQKCDLETCLICKITLFNLECIKCMQPNQLINGKCQLSVLKPKSENCIKPYYFDSQKNCKLCDIEYCKYCFEYSSNDLTKCTLYYNFIQFDKNEFHKIGCALCENGFIFDFNKGKCLYNKPSIQNCIRSFVNSDNMEICTLSQIDDFIIAPEINNCLNYIENCKQCIQTPQKEIKCILCQDGYTASIQTGLCYQCSIENVKNCIEGQFVLQDGWIQLVQSFLMQFLNNYFYPTTQNINKITELPIECQNGFQIISKIKCLQYCDQSCLSCIEQNQQFHCNQCPLNYYKQSIKSSENGKCIQCTQLCLVCQSRTIEEINKINPNFVINNSNQFYTHKCLSKIQDKNIVIDPYTNIAKYCYNSQCSDNLVFKVDVICSKIVQLFDERFPENYEKNVNIKYCNEFGVKKIVIKLNFHIIQIEKCAPFIKIIQISNTFKKNIFSLQQTHLQINGNYHQENIFIGKLEIYNFDSVEINQMKFINERPAYFSLNNDNKPVDLIIMNTLFQTNFQIKGIYQIKLNKYHKLILKNVTFDYMNIVNQSLIDCSQFDSNSEIFIENLQIHNSQFINSNLLTNINFHNKIIIENFQMINCQILESNIFQFNTNFTAQIDIIKIHIEYSYFTKSTFINAKGNLQINFIKTEFYNNTVSNSTIFYVNQRLQFSQTFLKQNDFINSIFILIDQKQEEKSLMEINDFFIEFNTFYNSILFVLDVKENEAEIYFTNFYLVGNKRLNEDTLKKSLFYLNSKIFRLQNCSIKDQFSLSNFQLFEVNSIQIQNITFFNQIQSIVLPLRQNCTENTEKNQLFLIQGFQNLEMRFIKIENQTSIDKSLIQILTNVLQFQNTNQTIYIEDMIFFGNIIQKFTQGELISLLLIYSEINQKITFKNLYFRENFYNQVPDDFSSSSAGLIYINSLHSVVNFQNISCYQNGLINSTSSFIFISSTKIDIANISIKNHNILSPHIWKKYYQIELQSHLEENEIMIFIKSIFQIKNKGGGLQIITTNLNLTQGYFENILSQSSQVIDIITKELGIIKLESINIQSIQTTLNSDSQGCISIYSKNSLLNFQLINTSFSKVHNRLNSAILTITPSLTSNFIKIQNVQLKDCISLTNQFFLIDFSYTKSDLYKVIIKNLTIIQNDQAWIQYFYMIQQLSSVEIDKITNDNAVINLYGCHLIIDGLNIEGTFISPIIKISDSPNIMISNCNFISIKTFYPLNILHFGQQMVSKLYINLQNIQFSNYSLFSRSIYEDLIIKTFHYQFSTNECNIDKILQSTQIDFQEFSIQTILDILNQNKKSYGSLIYLESISINNIIQFKSISISQCNCQGCLLGLLYFQIEQCQKIMLTDLTFTQNNVSQYGCLHFNSLNYIRQKIQLYNSLFLLNNGNIGSAIYSKYASIDIINCKFLTNKAISFGGAIYMQNCKNDFRIWKSLIMENNAIQGGGIFFNGINQLNRNNFEQSLVQLNTALLQSDNVIEIPHHLSLSINNQEMTSDQYQIQNITSNFLKLKNYTILEQGKNTLTNTFMIPSNQIISNYKLFNPKNFSYLNFIQELQINYKNSLNEKLINFPNSSCEINIFTHFTNNQTLIQSNSNQTIFYNQSKNCFDLGSISIIFNPYKDDDIQFQLQITCSTILKQNILQYLIKGRTLKCQLGEFYFNEGCQQCESDKGFYSVTYNTSKCSIFDKTKFKNITSNQIELLEGFWRPNHFSDLTELCFKNLKFCQGGWQIGNQLCQLGHIGALCEECDIYNIRGQGNYFKITSDSTCAECYDNKLNIIITIIFASFWSIFQIILTLRSIDESNKLFSQLKLRQRLSKILFKLDQDHQSILIKMFINYLWIFALIFTFNIQFPIFFGFVDKTSNPSIFMATSLECYTAEMHNIQLIYSRIVILFIVQLILFLLIYGGFKISSLTKNKIFNNSILSNTAIYLYISNYAEFAKQFTSLLSKRKISNIDFIQGDVSLEYNTYTHQEWIMSFVIPGYIIVCFLVPFLFFILLFILKNKLDEIKLRKHICYVFNEYKQENYYWEFIKIWQKIIMIFIIIYFETNIYLKGSLLGLSLLLYQAFALKLQPYLILKFNNLDLQTSQICSISIFLSIAKYASEQQNNLNWSLMLQFFIIILWMKLCYPFIKNILLAYYKIYKIHLLTSIHLIIKCCLPNNYLTKFIERKLISYEKKQVQINQNFKKLKQYLFAHTSIQRKKLLKNILLFRGASQQISPRALETETLRFTDSIILNQI